jgi:D-sedoheptulose 7-phosphate isomerase
MAPHAAMAASILAERMQARNAVSRAFFEREADRLARACREMAERFQRGGRLLAFGRGACATDAQHVSVEFVHPVIVGKRALPAIDLSMAFDHALPALLRPDDIVMGFGPPAGDDAVAGVLAVATECGALTFALPGTNASYAIPPPDRDAFVHQEIVEVLYHTLWETVHVFLEHRGHGHDVGASGFLYPFLESGRQDTDAVVGEVAGSIRAKAADVERLRLETAERQGEAIAGAAALVARAVSAGGLLLMFGNGGSATDANDWAFDCVRPPGGLRPVPALSLAAEPATLTALANDIGREAVFVRQLIAHGRPGDVAVGISTSGGSTAVIAALQEARRRGLATLALLGHDGGEVVRQGLADVAIVVACDYVPRIQEVQASIYHLLLEMVDAPLAAPFVAPGLPTGVSPASAGTSPLSPVVARSVSSATAGPAPARELFGAASCEHTAALREHLDCDGLAYVEHDVEVDPDALERMLALTGGQTMVPVLVASGKVVSIGWRGRGCVVGRRSGGRA